MTFYVKQGHQEVLYNGQRALASGLRPATPKDVTVEFATQVWGHYSAPDDDASEVEEIEAFRTAIAAALAQEPRQGKGSVVRADAPSPAKVGGSA